MEIIHVSAECYPVAKAGGLGDVVGALPKYQNRLGHVAKVVMPKYKVKFLDQNEFELVHESATYIGSYWFRYHILKEKTNKLGFDLYLIGIDGLTDRELIYGYDDDSERFLAFQIACLHWINQWAHVPDVVHCHDHHTGLIPFMMKYSYGLSKISGVRTVFTIHNGQYQGWMGWDKKYLLPDYDNWKGGLLEWNHMINPLASAVKCSDVVTTVSPSYMEELRHQANGLEKLFEYERGKCLGILNGIDNEYWDPRSDAMLNTNYDAKSFKLGKAANKAAICKTFGFNEEYPLFIFIGRLVGEKAAEILPESINRAIWEHDGKISILVLGSGDSNLERRLTDMKETYKGIYNCYIGYNESLAHNLYAAADFLLMPSRVEPCGLNQMYALRYGTIPMVRNTGGLKDTVIDIGTADFKGYGIVFNNPTVEDLVIAINRAVGWYGNNNDILEAVIPRIMAIDNSWERSAKKYIDIYK
ncbi:glycogen synthase [Polluticaenibacter yanchengensis]|uniref:Glycogen synthase n=1 Tax=Polluticaenibacter yanchengensis TaxID=3014562 RepID=A0ABT4UIJ1_9BACT|nr:glycogen/starch synthase [Chitinophagaceae bacterium LY-5]